MVVDMLATSRYEQKLLRFTSVRHGEECLILIRGKYYKALAVSCGVCGLDFKLLEDVPYQLNVDDGWDGNVMMGSHYARLIEENPTVIIESSGNDIEFWKIKDA